MTWASFIIPAILIVLIKVAVSDRPPAAPPGPFDRELRAFGNPSFVEAMSSTVGILFAWCGTPGLWVSQWWGYDWEVFFSWQGLFFLFSFNKFTHHLGDAQPGTVHPSNVGCSNVLRGLLFGCRCCDVALRRCLRYFPGFGFCWSLV